MIGRILIGGNLFGQKKVTMRQLTILERRENVYVLIMNASENRLNKKLLDELHNALNEIEK